jgi:Tol biopolymer transport system component
MTRQDDFDWQFKSWLDETASGSTSNALLESVLAATQQRRSRPALLVALRGGGMGTTIRVVRQPVRRLAYVGLLAAAVLALAAALLLAGSGHPTIGSNGPIMFYRTDDARSTNSPFTINPDGSGETALTDRGLLPGVWSPDGHRLLVRHLVTDRSPKPGAETAWIRPAVVAAYGSGFTLLDAYPDRKMQLDPVAWSPDSSRIFVYSGAEDVDQGDMGLYSVRSSDGGDLKRVLVTPPGYSDFVGLSPDGSSVLVSRFSKPSDGTLFDVNVDGTKRYQLTPPGVNVVDLQFWDGMGEAWSPDASRVAFAAFTSSDGSTGEFVVRPDGSDLRQVVPDTTGAISVQWSPDGTELAFTSELGAENQIWTVHPDGTGLRQLTTGTDGSVSAVPVWSPDGANLLFQRKMDGTVTLWTMNADGSAQTQLTPTPVASNWVGGYEWWRSR